MNMIDDPGPPSDGGRWLFFEQIVAEFLSDLMIQRARDRVRADARPRIASTPTPDVAVGPPSAPNESEPLR